VTTRRLWLASLLLVGLIGGEARAHFLFIRIGPRAEAGRWAEVYFSEQAQAGDPRFIDKVAHTELWLQSPPGEFRPLPARKASDRLRALVPVSGSVAVVGRCEYGVLARQVPFLLRYYPKAIAGRPEELNRMQRRAEIPLEVMANIDGGRVRLAALRDGRPLPGAAFHVVDADLGEEELTAGPDGQATWEPKEPGRYSIYTRQDTKRAGELDGKHYEVIREFATLALDWPLGRAEADPEAVSLFEQAVAARAQWKGFPGFTARVAGEVDGRLFEGKATIEADGSVALDGGDAALRPWFREQLESLAMHRLPPPGDGTRPVLRFAGDRDDHPLGRLLIFEGGRFASSYRIKDGQITVVNRHVGREDVTITTLGQERNGEGATLPRSYVVQRWDAATGALRRVETIQDRWQRVGSWDLPASHTVTIASDAGLSVRSFTLTEHALKGPEKASK
jgi:hypothetical protein